MSLRGAQATKQSQEGMGRGLLRFARNDNKSGLFHATLLDKITPLCHTARKHQEQGKTSPTIIEGQVTPLRGEPSKVQSRRRNAGCSGAFIFSVLRVPRFRLCFSSLVL